MYTQEHLLLLDLSECQRATFYQDHSGSSYCLACYCENKISQGSEIQHHGTVFYPALDINCCKCFKKLSSTRDAYYCPSCLKIAINFVISLTPPGIRTILRQENYEIESLQIHRRTHIADRRNSSCL